MIGTTKMPEKTSAMFPTHVCQMMPSPLLYAAPACPMKLYMLTLVAVMVAARMKGVSCRLAT